jgi:hypothetical protein
MHVCGWLCHTILKKDIKMNHAVDVHALDHFVKPH